MDFARIQDGIMRPQIATILEDGTYGQRDMTDEEIAELPTPTEVNSVVAG
jgi:hypothetical protein